MKNIRTLLCLSSLLLLPAFIRAAQVQYVVQVSLDGLGGTYLQNYLSNAPAQFPNFVRLTQEGASTMNARCDYTHSETIPNHTSVFTGRPVLQPDGQPVTLHHGIGANFPLASETVQNSGNQSIPYKASFFDVVHDYGLSTALFAGKNRFGFLDRSYNVTNGAPDLIGEDNGKDKIDFASVPANDITISGISNQVNEIVTNLTSATPARYTFIHLAEPDLTGHNSGWGSANWSNSVRIVDTQLGRILNAINANPVMSNVTALIVSADHGGGGLNSTTHSEAQYRLNYTIPFFIRGPKIPGGIDAYSLFANRGNPGTNRLDYNAVPQPIRNADGSNLALELLGLPPIPGSLTVPLLGGTNVQMNVARALDGSHTLWWPSSANAFVLEGTPAFGSLLQWTAISNGIVNNGGMFVYSFTNSPTQTRFFRLRKL